MNISFVVISDSNIIRVVTKTLLLVEDIRVRLVHNVGLDQLIREPMGLHLHFSLLRRGLTRNRWGCVSNRQPGQGLG